MTTTTTHSWSIQFRNKKNASVLSAKGWFYTAGHRVGRLAEGRPPRLQRKGWVAFCYSSSGMASHGLHLCLQSWLLLGTILWFKPWQFEIWFLCYSHSMERQCGKCFHGAAAPHGGHRRLLIAPITGWVSTSGSVPPPPQECAVLGWKFQ